MRWDVTTPETGPAPSRGGSPVRGRVTAEAAARPPRAGQPRTPPRPAAPRRRAPAGRSRRGEPRTYDFRRPTKLSREHVRVLQIAQEAFARQATTILTTFLRAGARLELVGIEQFSYDDYVETLPNPVFITTFTLEPLAGKGLLAYPLDIAMAIVDHMLGGSGTRRAAEPADDGDGDHHHQPPAGPAARRVRRPRSRTITEIQPALDGLRVQPAAGPGRLRARTPSWSPPSRWRSAAARARPPWSCRSPRSPQALNNAASPQLSESALRQAQARRRGADRPAQPRAGRRQRPVRAADGLLGRPALPRRRRRPPAAPPAGRPLEVTTNDVTFAYAIASNHRRRLAAAIVPTPHAAAKDTA